MEGLTIAIARNSVARLKFTLDYSASEGFTLKHPSPPARECGSFPQLTGAMKEPVLASSGRQQR